MKKSDKIIYYVATGLLCALMLFSGGMYIFNNAEVNLVFMGLGFPTFLIYPMAIAKILGVVAVASRLSPFLKNLAYAGFFFNLLLAFGAHININDGDFPGALIGLVLLATSYFFEKRAFAAKPTA